MTRVARGSGVAVASLGAGYLTAWVGGQMAHRGISSFTMKTNAALALTLSGAALVLLTPADAGDRRRWAGRACAALALLIGALTLSENLMGWHWGIDQLLAWEQPGAMGVIHPNRMGTPASLCIALAGASLLILSRRSRRGVWTAQSLALVGCLLSLMSAIGFLYDINGLYGIARFTAIAWPSVVALLVLGVGLLCARPGEGLMSPVTADDPGGIMIRRLLLPMVLVPVGLGWLRLTGERMGWYGAGMGTGILVLLFIVTFTALAWFAGRRVSLSARQVASVAQFPGENPHPVLRIASDGRMLYANAATRAVLQHEGWGAGDAVPPALLDPAMSALKQCTAGEFEWVCRDGRALAFLSVPLADKGYVNLYGRDVSEARRAAESLRASEERHRIAVRELQAIMDATPAGICVAHDAQCRLITGNRPAHELLGVPPGENISATPAEREASPYFSILRDGREVPGPDLPMQVAGATGATVHDVELEAVRRDGTRRVFLINAAPLSSPDGTVRGAVGAFTDITERKRAAEALARLTAESEQRRRLYETVLSNTPDQVYVFDLSHRFTYANNALLKMWGRTWEESIGRTCLELGYPDWHAAMHDREIDQVVAHRRPVKGEVPFDGTCGRRIYEYIFVPVLNTDGEVEAVAGTTRDVTERRQSEEALAAAKIIAEQAKADAEEASRAKDHFLAVLSHELRTPLTPVVAAVSMLQKQCRGDEATAEMLEMVRRNVEMEARLIDDLLDVTRIVRGKVELNMERVPLCEVIRRTVEVCRSDIEARQLRFIVDTDAASACFIHADAGRLQQAFWNLLKNAVKFTPQGGCVGIRCGREEEMVAVEVMDSGEGIDPAALPHIFNAFEQGGARVTRQFGGLGLGLTITRGLVELHGGSIEAHSDGMGKGAIFRVRLPLLPDSEASTPAMEPPESASECDRPGMRLRILLVEDHGDTARIMWRLLTAEGHLVHMAGDVAAALGLAASHTFDLLISDLGLPDGSGDDLMRSLRGRGLLVPGIAVSGYGQEEDVRRSRESGFAEHLTKPVDVGRLRGIIARVAGTRRP